MQGSLHLQVAQASKRPLENGLRPSKDVDANVYQS
jgi:hypothetical protein